VAADLASQMKRSHCLRILIKQPGKMLILKVLNSVVAIVVDAVLLVIVIAVAVGVAVAVAGVGEITRQTGKLVLN